MYGNVSGGIVRQGREWHGDVLYRIGVVELGRKPLHIHGHESDMWYGKVMSGTETCGYVW